MPEPTPPTLPAPRLPPEEVAGRFREVVAACERLLGRRVAWVQLPGGRGRAMGRLGLEDGTRVIAGMRRELVQAQHEARVLRALRAAGAPVPEVLGFEGRLLVQSDLGETRLSQALDGAEPERVLALLDAALDGLVRVQRAGSAAGLEAVVLEHATRERAWFLGLFDRVRLYAEGFALPAPALPLDALVDLLTVPRPRFVKWDARPANAALGEDGAIGWFDFEDAVARCRLDDLVWLLADEFVPDLPEVEARLLETWLPAFRDDRDAPNAHAYLRAFGVFHALVRLGLILDRKDQGPWWSWAFCLTFDKAGVSHAAAVRLLLRAARWAEEVDLLRALGPWLRALAERLPPAELAAAA